MGLFPTFKEIRSRSPWDDFWYNPAGIGLPTAAGTHVNEETAIKYITLFACVSLISGDLARVPLILYKRDGKSKKRADKHPLYDVLKAVTNPETTSFNWRETNQINLLLWGNTYNQIIRDGNGKIIQLVQIPDPGGMQIERRNGQLIYTWKVGTKEFSRRREDIFHIPGFGYNGLFGLSMIAIARESIGLALALEDFGSKYFGNGTHPTGVAQLPNALGDPEKKKQWIQDFNKQYSQLGNAHNVMVLDRGAEYKPLSVPMEDAQFLQSRDHQKSDICGMYHVPPHKVALHGSNSNYSNLEQENQGYIDSCLIHWVTRWEQNISLQLLTPKERSMGYFAEFELKGLLRGDSQARSEFYKMLLNGGVPMNNILALENMEPVEGGDVGYIQGAMVPVNQMADLIKSKLEPKAPPVIPAEPEEPKEPVARAEFRSKRSIAQREKISQEYLPIFEEVAQKVVDFETTSIRSKLTQSNIDKYLEEFYRDLPVTIKREMGPTFRRFAEAIKAVSVTEIGFSTDIEDFVNDYIERFTERYVESSTGQLRSLGEEEEVETRLDEWDEKRAEKVAVNETVRESNAIYQTVAFAAGLAVVWKIRGKTCPYCTSLEGKRVATGETFVSDGDVLKDGSGGTMKINGLKSHPPLHQGCDCYIGI